jgi:hypothetical protein
MAAFTRAILAAQERLAAGTTAELAARLPRSVVGAPEEFEARVRHAKTLYLVDGRVTAEQLAASVDFLGDQLPLPARARVQLVPPGRVKTTPGR